MIGLLLLAVFIDAPNGAKPGAPAMRCAALQSLSEFEFTIESAVLVPASGDTPEFCQVMGNILPEIRFEVALPAKWNRRFHLTGNGGFAGDSLDSPQRVMLRSIALRRGFAAAVTNTGHDGRQEPLASFAVNRQKLLDYAFRSLHVTTVAGKRIAEAYYGDKTLRSYYQGCSTGGRQGLILAQRYPEDFDGIVAGAPVLDFTNTMTSFACTAQALTAAPIPFAKLAYLAERIYELCDAKDGLKDGLIDDPRRCAFQPARDLAMCASTDHARCFTQPQIGALEKIYGDIRGADGKLLHPGWPVGAEVNNGWDNWIIRANGEKTIAHGFAESFFKYMAFPRKEQGIELKDFDVTKHPQQLDWIRKILDATDPDLSAFRDRRGKLLMYFGWADQSLNAQMGVNYYESVVQRMGLTTGDFFRLFMQPGVFHCGGGVGPGSFEPLPILVDWVENNRPPDRIEASQSSNGKVTRTRPLCPYPQVARNTGAGSIDEAANFRCVAP